MKKNIISKIVIYLFMSIFALVQLFPLYWLVLFSLKTNREIVTKSALALPEKFLYQNYLVAWVKGNVYQYFFNSVVIAIISLALTLLFSCMIAYAIARMKWKLGGLTLFVFLAGLMIPIHATLIPLFIILNKMHLLSTIFSLVLPYSALGLPLGVFVFSNFLRSVPFELEAAAFIDGCGVLRTFFKIIIPVIKPAIATVGIFTFLANWNEFIMAATFLQNPKLRTLPLWLMAFQGEHSVDWGPMGASIIIASVPTVIIYLIFSERVENGFTAGAVLK